MTNPNQVSQVILEIEALIKAQFMPEFLSIRDESYLHRKHTAAILHGGGHFKILIRAQSLDHLPLIKKHQAIYRCLAALMRLKIHALKIQILDSTC